MKGKKITPVERIRAIFSSGIRGKDEKVLSRVGRPRGMGERGGGD